MPRRAEPLLHYLRRWVSRRGTTGIADSVLLDGFLQGQQAAFTSLVERHGPMVWNVCQRVLGHVQDTEDAFQATFLVLARKAYVVRPRSELAAWLHGVAFRVALKARTTRARRQRIDTLAAIDAAVQESPDPLAGLTARELCLILDEEVQKLPVAYRQPVILCCIEGRSREEAARQLGMTPAAIKGRLERGRTLLQRRLRERGIVPSLAMGAILCAVRPGAALSQRLVQLAVQTCSAGGVSADIEALAQAVAIGSLFTRAHVAVVLAVGLLSGTTVLLHRPATMAEAGDIPQNSAPVPMPSVRSDRRGDPLPPGAVARLGTSRFNHGDGLSGLFYTPDKRFIISTGNGLVRRWDAVNGGELGKFAINQFWIGEQSLSSNGQELHILSQDSPDTFRVWDLIQGVQIRELKLPIQRTEFSIYRHNALSPGGWLAAIHTTEQIHVFDLATGKELCKLARKGMEIDAVVFAGTNHVVTADKQCLIEVWDAQTGRRTAQFLSPARLPQMEEQPFIIASSNGSRLATLERRARPFPLPDGGAVSVHERDVIHIWDLNTGSHVRELVAKPKQWHINIQFSPDGKLLFAASTHSEQRHNSVDIWNLENGDRVRELEGIWGHTIAVSPDGTRLAAGAVSKFEVWDVQSGRCRSQADGEPALSASILLAPNGDRIFSIGRSSVECWDGATGRHVKTAPLPAMPHLYPARRVFLSDDGTYAVSVGDDQERLEMLLWNTATGQPLHTLRHPGPVKFFPKAQPEIIRTRAMLPSIVVCAFSQDASLLATWQPGKDGSVRFWDVKTGTLLGSFPETRAGYTGKLFWTPDAKTLIVAGPQVVGYEVPTGRELFAWRVEPLPGPKGQWKAAGGAVIEHLAWRAFTVSPDGTTVACVLTRGDSGIDPLKDRISLFDARSGKVIRRWDHSGKSGHLLEELSFSADGKLLVSSDQVGTHVWEVATGQELQSFHGHRGEVQALAFSAGGRRLITAGTDATVILWNLRN
jgi:RNA polymerase sigma factor (sigma-70 family)